jgi:hypothetical protein
MKFRPNQSSGSRLIAACSKTRAVPESWMSTVDEGYLCDEAVVSEDTIKGTLHIIGHGICVCSFFYAVLDENVFFFAPTVTVQADVFVSDLN